MRDARCELRVTNCGNVQGFCDMVDNIGRIFEPVPEYATTPVIPAKAGIQPFVNYEHRDPRLRGNDNFKHFGISCLIRPCKKVNLTCGLVDLQT